MKSRYRRCCLTLCLLALWACLFTGFAGAAVQVKILKLNSAVFIHDDASVQVNEKIVVYVPESGRNHGLMRSLSLAPRGKELRRPAPELTVLSVTMDGQELSVSDSRRVDDEVRVYMRDKSRFMEKGEHTFILKYRLTQQTEFFGQDELTWNVTGSAWAGGVKSSVCFVMPPEGADFVNSRAWLGRPGTDSARSEADISIKAMRNNGRPMLVFRTERAIEEGEDFTFAVALPQGSIEKNFESYRPEEDGALTAALVALLLVCAAWCTLLWYRFGRDPKLGPVIPLFYPPKIPPRLRKKHGDSYLSAMAVNYIWNNRELTARGLAAGIIALAGKKGCSFSGGTLREPLTIRREAGAEPDTAEEKKLWESLPDADDRIVNKMVLDESSGPRLNAIKSACEKILNDDYHDQWKKFKGGGGRTLLLLLLAYLPLPIGQALLLRWHLGPFGTWPTHFLSDLNVFCSVLVCIPAATALALYGIVKGKKCVTALLSLIFFLLPGWGVLFSLLVPSQTLIPIDLPLDIFWIIAPWQLLLMLLPVLIPLAFLPFMDLPSVEAAGLRHEVAGLAMYINMAEKDRLNIANPPDRPLELYHRILPYAVALGLEEAWGARFAGELEKLTEQEEIWTYGDEMRHQLLMYRLTGRLRRDVERYVDIVSSPVSSSRDFSSSGSSFSEGGGGAGSGGGGIGGGAC